jgi:hypothetical protein
VVFRGVFNKKCADVIKAELRSQFLIGEVIRMRSYKNKISLPLVIIKLPKTETTIYHLKNIGYISFLVKPLKNSSRIGQCFRCQQYGHSSRYWAGTTTPLNVAEKTNMLNRAAQIAKENAHQLQGLSSLL